MNNKDSASKFAGEIHISLWMIFILAVSAASSHADELAFRSDFSDLKSWENDSHETSPASYGVSDGILRISTRPNTRDRVKVRTGKRFGIGRYSWRVFVPSMGEGDQASIGAFIYSDDRHEIDFEIGYGKAKVRETLKAGPGDLVCYCTSQGNPANSEPILIKNQAWHILSLDVAIGKEDNYLMTWFVGDKQVKQLQCNFGDEINFSAHCSVENLGFIGDHIPKQTNHALFDYFEFTPAVKDQAKKAKKRAAAD